MAASRMQHARNGLVPTSWRKAEAVEHKAFLYKTPIVQNFVCPYFNTDLKLTTFISLMIFTGKPD